MLDAFTEHFERDADCDRLHMERFQPKLGLGRDGAGEGGTIKFCMSECEAESDGKTPILVAGEEEGLDSALRLPRGHLPHVRGRAAQRAGSATCATARSTGRRAR